MGKKERNERLQKAEIQKKLEEDIRQQIIKAEEHNDLSDNVETNVTVSRNCESKCDESGKAECNSDINLKVNLSEQGIDSSLTTNTVIESSQCKKDTMAPAQLRNVNEVGDQEDEEGDEEDWEWEDEEEDTQIKETVEHQGDDDND